MVAAPDITCLLTPPGGSAVDYSGRLAWDGAAQPPTITQNFGRQGDTATLTLVDEYDPTVGQNIPAIKFGSQISLYDNTISKSLFAGVVIDPTLGVTGAARNEWTMQCTDYSFYANNAVVRGVFKGWTVDQIVISLTEQANCGISAVSLADGGFVAPGPQLANVSFGWSSLTQAWIKLAQLAGQVVPYGWYVDEALRLHFYDSTNAVSSGVTFTTSPTVAGSATEAHIALDSSFAYEWDGSSLANRWLLQGSTQTIKADLSGTPTDVFLGDGTTTSWPLRYTLNGNPTLTWDNLLQSVTTFTDPSSVPTVTWWVQPNANGQWFLGADFAPPAGALLQLWYDYDVPVVAQVNDRASQAEFTGPNGGVFARFVSDSSLSSLPMALAAAQRQRQEYAFPVERMTWTSTEEWIGWVRAGETIQVVNEFVPDSQNNYVPGIDDTFLVVQNQPNFGQGGYRTMQLTAVRV